MENIARKLQVHINHGKTKYMIVEQKNSSKQNKTGQLTTKNYTFETADIFKYLGIILNADNNHQIDLQENKYVNKTYLMLQKILETKIYLKN